MNPQDPNIRTPQPLDLIEMARFLVLPGAEALLRAFARIPPGDLRNSVITHAEVIASTYSAAPPEQQMPDPLFTASQASPVLPLPQAPRKALAHARKPINPEEAVVAARTAGLNKDHTPAETGINRQAVDAALRGAAKAGVKFPPVQVVPTPTKSFVTRVEDVSMQGRANMELAAAKYGHSLESWMQARATLVEMRLANKPIEEIAAAIKPPIPEKMLWQWIYVARQAGIPLATAIDYDDAEIVAETPPAASQKAHQGPKPGSLVPGPGVTIFTPIAQMEAGELAGAAAGVRKAAAARGMTPEAFFELREVVIRHRYAGKGPTEIYSLVGQDMDFIKNCLSNAQEKGVVFPPVTSTFNSAAWSRTHKVRKNAGLGTKGGWPKKTHGEFALRPEDSTTVALTTIARSLRKGQTLESYFAVRREAVRAMLNGRGDKEIASTLKLTNKQVSNWRARAGRRATSKPSRWRRNSRWSAGGPRVLRPW